MTLEEALALIKTMEAASKDMQKQFDSLKANQDDLMDEAKDSKIALSDYKEQVKEKEEKARTKKATDEGDLQTLLNDSEKKREALQVELDEEKVKRMEYKNKIGKEKAKNIATKMASEISDGDNVGLLSDIIERRLAIKDGEVKVTDAGGDLTVSSLEDLKKEIQSNKIYKSLLRGSQASGAGGKGGSGGAETKNPFKKGEDFNLTEQGRLTKEDPALAEQLKLASKEAQ